MKTQEKSVLNSKRESIVTFLKEPLVSFVSLVKHGANNTPFRFVKKNKGGSDMGGKVIQAIMVPKDSTINVKELMGEDTRDDIVAEEGNYKLYEQVDKSAVDVDSKSLVVVDPDKHVYAVTYDLIVDKKVKDDKIQKDAAKENVARDIKEVGFYDVWEELMALGDMVSGVMSQSLASPEDRKSTVLKAIDNFRGFCEAVFSQAKSGETFTPVRKIGDVAVGDLTILNNNVSELLKTQKQGGSSMNEFGFENKEELGAFVAEIVTKTLEKRDQDADTLQAAKDAQTAEQAKDEDFKKLKETVEKVVETVEKVSGTVVNPKSDNADETTIQDKKEQKPGKYEGLFSKLQTSPGAISQL